MAADVIEVSEFPDIAQRYQVFGVPKTIMNEKVSFEGAVPEAEFLKRLREAAGMATAV